MRSICLVTDALYPVQSFEDSALEVAAWAQAWQAEGHRVAVLWLVGHLQPPAEAAPARKWYQDRGVDLVLSTDLEPFLAADEVFGREAGLRLWPALRKLHRERKFDWIEVPAGEGLAARIVQASLAGRDLNGTRVVVRLGKFGEWKRWRARRLALTRDEVKRDFMERETVEGAKDVLCGSRGLLEFAERIGWQIGHVRGVEPPPFSPEDVSTRAETPCFLGEAGEGVEGIARAVAKPGAIREWMLVPAEPLDEKARQRLRHAVAAGRCRLEILASRRWDILPATLREKGAVVVFVSGVDDARFRWLCAARVAGVFSRDLLKDLPELAPFSELFFLPEDPESLATAVENAREFSDWPAFFRAVDASGGGKSMVPAGIEVTAQSPSPRVRPDTDAPPGDPARVLIAVSHFNLGPLLAETLEALGAQDHPACEVMVVDDGSTDEKSLEIFRGLKGDFSSFHFVELPHEGYWSPRNFAIRECQAPYVIIVDGDNLPVPHMASRFVLAMERNPACAAFSSYVSAFRETRENARAGRFEGAHTPLGGDFVSGHFENVYGDTNSIFRIGAIRDIGGFREHFACSFGDWEIFHRLVGAGFRLGVVPEVLLHYRRRGGGMIRQSPLFPNFFELFASMEPGRNLRRADLRRLHHALHGLGAVR